MRNTNNSWRALTTEKDNESQGTAIRIGAFLIC